MFTTTHGYPDRRVELHFFRCELLGEPRPQLGQEMRWVRREELAALEFPPADAELIQHAHATALKTRQRCREPQTVQAYSGPAEALR